MERAGDSCIDAAPSTCMSCSHRFCDLLPGDAFPQRQCFKEFQRGDRLPTGTSSAKRFWVIIEGMVALSTSLTDGRRQILGLETAGGVICSAFALPGSATTAEVLDKSRMCELTFAGAVPDDCQDRSLRLEVSQLLHQRLLRLGAHSVALGRLDSLERIYWFLAEMARRLGTSREGALRVSIPLSREDIADYLGLNTETVSRLCSRVKKNGHVVFISPTEYVVPDLAALERRIPFAPLAPTPRERSAGLHPAQNDLGARTHDC